MPRAISVDSCFSARVWKVLTALAFGIVFLVCRANAQAVDTAPPPLQITPASPSPYKPGPYEQRVQEVIRRLNLSANPALKEEVEGAYAAERSCMENAMRQRVIKGIKDSSELVAGACRACDKQVIAYAKIFFEANKHRYMEPDLESEIKRAQQACLTSFWPDEIKKIRSRAERSIEPPPQTAMIARYGEWELTEEVNFEGRIAYRATLHDRNDKSRSIQWKCWPSKRDSGIRLWLFDDAIKNTELQNFIVSFNNSRIRTVDQFETAGNDGHVDLDALSSELLGCGICNPTTAPHDGLLFLAVRDRKMEFNPSGADDAFTDLARRCHF
jgi:hypothetical protein